MANAFYSLYSHVTRTPVQKLPTPEFNFSTIERMERFRSSVRSDPRSPVDKLKDTVSKLCLYTGSNREFDSPLPSPNKVVTTAEMVVLEKPRHKKKIELGQEDLNAEMDVCMDDQGHFNVDIMELLPHTTKEEVHLNGETNNELVYSEHTDLYKTKEFNVSSLSKLESSDVTGDRKPLVKNSNEHICPQILEHVHQVPFVSQYGCLKTTGERTYPAVKVDESQALSSSQVNSTSTCCCTTVTAESDRLFAPDTKTRMRTDIEMKYLSPEPFVAKNLQQVNSFELEEVHSAGEEDLGQCETSTTVPSWAMAKSSASHFTGDIVRGDSMQSDSSGYADDVPSEHPNEATQ